MKRLLLSILLIVAVVFEIEAQGHYENDFIRFDYSSEYKRAEISSAQHMLIKLEKGDSFFSISEWKYGLDPNIDVWNDDIINTYKTLPIKDGKLVTIEKRLIDIKSGRQKSIFILSNIVSSGVGLKNATCLFIHRGNLYVLCHMSPGKYLSSSQCKEFLDLLKGLSFKKPQNDSSNQQFREKANNEDGYWDELNSTYVNFFYGFSWNLDKELGWNREIGTELHTVFKARAKDLPLFVFVNANDYNDKLLNVDIWDKFEELKKLQEIEIKKIGEEVGGSYEMLSFEKTKLWNKNAIRYVNVIRMDSSNLYANESSYIITYKTIHNGRLFSVNIEMSLAMYNLIEKENINVDELLSAFKFTAGSY